MEIKPLREDLKNYLKKHHLEQKWGKAVKFFQDNPSHPSLAFELLEPGWRGVYAFRIDRKYRALLFLVPNGKAEIFKITNHYKK